MTAVSDAQCRYVLQGLSPGDYRIEVITEGFETSRSSTVRVVARRTLAHNVQVAMAVAQEKVTVSTASTVDTEPPNNASAMTLSGSAPRDTIRRSRWLGGGFAGAGGTVSRARWWRNLCRRIFWW